VARLNFSHGTHSAHLKVIKNIRSVANELNQSIAILLDLQGPRIRLGDLPEKGIELKKGQEVILTTDTAFQNGKIPVTYEKMHEDVAAGQRVLIADGIINLLIKKVRGKEMVCEVVNGGTVTSHKGMNLPDTNVTVPSLSVKDKEDLLFGIKNDVDYVALSFVRTAKEVYELKDLIEKYEKKLKIKNVSPVKVIVKIERKEAIDNIDEIVKATDAVMVARGDLGIELPAEDVPLMQKMLIDKCLEAAKPVIVATQMLESMITNPRPTRAEISDVANAVIDHTDAIMLSGETAVGKFPAEAVDYMKKTVVKTEKSAYDDLSLQEKTKKIVPTSEAIGSVAKMLSMHVDAKLILIGSITGNSARLVSRYRPELPILVACEDDRVKRQLSLTWGAIPFVLPPCKTIEKLIGMGINYLKENKFAKKGDQIIIVGGSPVGRSGQLNLVEIIKID